MTQESFEEEFTLENMVVSIQNGDEDTLNYLIKSYQPFIIVMTPDGLFQKAFPIRNALIGNEVYYIPLELTTKQSFLSKIKGYMSFPMRIIIAFCLLLVLVIPSL